MTLLSLKQARGRPNTTFPNSHYTPQAFLLQIKANSCPFPWQDRVHTAGTAEKDTGVTVGFKPLERVLGHKEVCTSETKFAVVVFDDNSGDDKDVKSE